MTKRKCFLLGIISLLLSGIQLLSQSASFVKRYGSSASDDALQMISCKNGGYLLLSGSGPLSLKANIIRLDDNGNTIWKRQLWDTSAVSLLPKKVIQTKDKGFCVLAAPKHNLPSRNPSVLIKIDSIGQPMWETGIELYSYTFNGTDLAEASDGSIYIIGNGWYNGPSSDPSYPYIVRTNDQGQFQWYKRIQYSNMSASKIAIQNDTIFVGIASSQAFHILKVDSSGYPITTLSYSATFNLNIDNCNWATDSVSNIKALLLSDINGDVFLCKLNSSGFPTTSIRASYPGFGLIGVQLIQTDTNFIGLLETNASPPVIVTDWSSGQSVPNAIQIGFNNPFLPISIAAKTDSSLLVYGSPSSSSADLYVVKTDIPQTGILPVSGCSVNTTVLIMSPITVSCVSDNILFDTLTPFQYIPHITNSPIILSQNLDCFLTGFEENKAVDPIEFYPNPNNGSFWLEGNFSEGSRLEIFNAFGQIVQSFELPPGYRRELLWLPVADGVYMWRVRSGELVTGEGKVCILRQ